MSDEFNHEADAWDDAIFDPDNQDEDFSIPFQGPYTKRCIHCGVKHLRWGKTNYGWRLFNEKNELHSCLSYNRHTNEEPDRPDVLPPPAGLTRRMQEAVQISTNRRGRKGNNIKDARHLHDACHEAMLECPQFRGWDDDTIFEGWGEFGNIPNLGLAKTIKFWREEGYLLWEHHYEDCLPEEYQRLFREIDVAIERTIEKVIHGVYDESDS